MLRLADRAGARETVCLVSTTGLGLGAAASRWNRRAEGGASYLDVSPQLSAPHGRSVPHFLPSSRTAMLAGKAATKMGGVGKLPPVALDYSIAERSRRGRSLDAIVRNGGGGGI